MNKAHSILITIFITIMQTHCIDIPHGLGVNFYESMECIKEKVPEFKQSHEWNRLEEIYNQNIVHSLNYRHKERIPKIIHQIWLGSPYPEKHANFRDSWLTKHPDWEYKLWTDKEIQALGLVNKEAYESSSNYGQKSDIARYEILYRFGGLYIDTDFECLKPFDIFHHCLNFYTGTDYGKKCGLFNGLIGSIPGHPILKECIESLDITQILDKNPIINIIKTSGPVHLARAFLKYIQKSSDACVAFPVGYFYPWPNNHIKENKPEQIQQWIRPESFAIHHWHFSWKRIHTLYSED